jgi:hypothetical protein
VPGSSALYRPTALAVEADGSIDVVETGNCRIDQIANGQMRVLAGSVCGYADGPAGQAKFLPQAGIAVLADGSVAVSDPGNYRIRRISQGRVTTLAGSGKFGFQDGTGDQAELVVPAGLAVRQGILYVADAGNAALRAVVP